MKQPKAVRKQPKRPGPAKTGGTGKGGKSTGGKPPAAHKPGQPFHAAAHHTTAHHTTAHHTTAPQHHAAHHKPLHHQHRVQPKKPAKRKLALAGDVACCAAEALAATLRLAGWPVGPSDVLALYGHTAGDPDAGAFIPAALEAAYAHGLAGVRPVSFAPVDPGDPAASILGLDLPGPHAVAATPEGWWSWGSLHDPAGWLDAVIEEAWAVRWQPATA
jgi:hypothetical protein